MTQQNTPSFESREDDKKKRRKLLIALLLLLVAAVMAVGTIIAFFSDVVRTDTDITTGRLNIDATYTYAVNGVDAGETITNLSPGDVVTVTATITNNGNMSAWVREIIDFNDLAAFQPFIEVHRGVFTREQLAGGGDLLAITDGQIITTARVLNGSGEGAQVETGVDYEYIGADNYSVSFTVYFLPEAGNELQNSNFGFGLTTQALQFANNNANLPADAAWNSVAAAPAI